MKIAPINNYHTENGKKQSFKALKISHSPEMKTAKKLFEKNCPDFYNNLINSLKELLGKTNFFDGLLDIEHGQFVLRMMHKKNFVWPGRETGLVYNTEKVQGYISRGTKETEFHPDYNRILRLIKIKEDKHKVTYSVKDFDNKRPYSRDMWSLKASTEQAQLIKELDDTILDMSSKGSVYLGYGEGEMEYFPLTYNIYNI